MLKYLLRKSYLIIKIKIKFLTTLNNKLNHKHFVNIWHIIYNILYSILKKLKILS